VDTLKKAALVNSIPWLPTSELKHDEAYQRFAGWKPDLGVMAFVTDILSKKLLAVPRLGTIQYHPSLLPRHRGASAINWAIAMGETTTGLTIFWPDSGIDTGPVLLQKQVEIAPDDTLGTLYFNKLFPLGVEALMESVELVEQDRSPRIPQDESQATYDPIFISGHAAVNWSKKAQQVYDLVRGADPQPGAATTYRGERMEIFDCKLIPGATSSKPGEVLVASDQGLEIALVGGALLVKRLRAAGSAKVSAADFIRSSGIKPGDTFGS
ncbi:MAG: methionyl-tRNA formyltransferase, partial [Dehalococcoidia bacterium]|nr:methionyl-tRNA formyltransferase [Dehalococcoidia bacterium]